MLRLLFFVVVLTLAALAGAELANLPGEVSVSWLGYHFDINIYLALAGVAGLAFVLSASWALVRYLFGRPKAISRYLAQRSEERGREAITRGMIAAELGDADVLGRSATTARKSLPTDPLTALLGVKAARLAGDRETTRMLLEDMTQSSETKLAGLHGLYLEAKREDELEAARQFAEQALEENPRLAWSSEALLDLQARSRDWDGALETLQKIENAGHLPREDVRRKRAVLLTASALEVESGDLDKSRDLALEAHGLAPELVPAAALAVRLLAAQESERRAWRVAKSSWALSPHPELAKAYAYLRVGEAPAERLKRVRDLVDSAESGVEGAIAIADAAVEARDWEAAREALEPVLADKPTARAYSLMARVEEGASGDTGRVREWLGRALRAPRDPAWMCDGIVFKEWAPLSPLNGKLDAFTWMAPVEALEGAETPIIEAPIETEADSAEGDLAPEPEAAAVQPPPHEVSVAGDEVSGEEASAPEPQDDALAAQLRQAEEAAASLTLSRRPDDPGEQGTFAQEEAKREQPVADPERDRSD